MDNFYVKFVACEFTVILICLFAHTFFYIVACLIGCSSLQHTKTPWSYVTKTIEKLEDEGVRSHFIKDLEVLYQRHYGSEDFCLKLADLVVANAS